MRSLTEKEGNNDVPNVRAYTIQYNYRTLDCQDLGIGQYPITFGFPFWRRLSLYPNYTCRVDTVTSLPLRRHGGIADCLAVGGSRWRSYRYELYSILSASLSYSRQSTTRAVLRPGRCAGLAVSHVLDVVEAFV